MDKDRRPWLLRALVRALLLALVLADELLLALVRANELNRTHWAKSLLDGSMQICVNQILEEEQQANLDDQKVFWLESCSPLMTRVQEIHFVFWECLIMTRVKNVWCLISKWFMA